MGQGGSGGGGMTKEREKIKKSYFVGVEGKSR
jgi:hypothetical protein